MTTLGLPTLVGMFLFLFSHIQGKIMNDDSKQSQTITEMSSDSLYVKDVPTSRDMPIYYETHPIKTVNIGIEQEIDSMPIPEYQTPEAAGFDLCASQPAVIQPKTHELIHTGIHLEIPFGYHVEVRSRSGLAAKHGVFVLNSPGTVDSDYTGEICVILCNLGNEPYVVEKGDRIAQGVLMKHEIAVFVKKHKVSKNTERGSGGFGSTGVS